MVMYVPVPVSNLCCTLGISTVTALHKYSSTVHIMDDVLCERLTGRGVRVREG